MREATNGQTSAMNIPSSQRVTQLVTLRVSLSARQCMTHHRALMLSSLWERRAGQLVLPLAT